MARSPSGNRGRTSGEFNQATPIAYRKHGGNPAAMQALGRIDDRAARIKTRAVEHYKKFQDRWVAKEIIRIWQKRLAQNAQHPAPPGVSQQVSAEEISKLAERVVRARTVQRLSRINTIKTRMTNAVARNFDTPPLVESFHRAVTNTQKQQIRRKP